MGTAFRSFALGLALSTVVEAARADVLITGTLDHLRIEASRAPIVDVLEALKRQFGIVYKYRARPDWTVDGAFTGSLSSILPRIFRDKDYIFRTEPNRPMTVFLPSPQAAGDAPIPSPPVQAPGPQPSNEANPPGPSGDEGDGQRD